MNSGQVSLYEASAVKSWLKLTDEDVSRITSTSLSATGITKGSAQRAAAVMNEITAIFGLVAMHFAGDTDRTLLWFKTRNPHLGDVAPRDLIRLGRHERLRKFVNMAITPS